MCCLHSAFVAVHAMYRFTKSKKHLHSEPVFDFSVGQVKTALQLSSEEFKEKYGGEKPQQSDNIVFSCLAGIRSKKALDTAISLGYKE